MLYAVFWVLVGMFVGWNLPQPPWAKELQDKVVNAVKAILGK